jgi:hypothetical protein
MAKYSLDPVPAAWGAVRLPEFEAFSLKFHRYKWHNACSSGESSRGVTEARFFDRLLGLSFYATAIFNSQAGG